MDQLQNLINPQPEDEKVSSRFLNQIGKVKFGVLAVVSLAIIGGGVYLFSSVSKSSSEPPTLEFKTSSMAQGMAKKSVKQIPGFAKFTDQDVEAYKCNSKFEVALGNRVEQLFAKQKVTLKEIAGAIHPTKGSQYLIAVFEPASVGGKSKDTYYLYPTDSSPFMSTKTLDVIGTFDGDVEVPAYIGFQVVTDDPDTLFCKGSLFKISTDDIWHTKDGEEISFDLSVKILKSMRVLPKGWALLPAGNNTSVIGGMIDLFGKDAVDVAFYKDGPNSFKKFDYDKDWNKTTGVGTKLSYNAVWFHLNKKVNVVNIIDEILSLIEESSGSSKKQTKTVEAEATTGSVVEEESDETTETTETTEATEATETTEVTETDVVVDKVADDSADTDAVMDEAVDEELTDGSTTTDEPTGDPVITDDVTTDDVIVDYGERFIVDYE